MVNVVDPIQVRGKVIPADELSWRFSRSSGPGGQSVNTSDSRVELSYDLAASSALGPPRPPRPGGRPSRPVVRGNAGSRPSSAAPRSNGSAGPPTSDQAQPVQLRSIQVRRRPVTVTASPQSAIS